MYIPPDSVAGRVAIGMTTIMTMTTMFGGVRESVPKVSYITLLDIWMVMCIFFIFLVLIEFAVVTSLIRRHQKPTAEKIEGTSIKSLFKTSPKLGIGQVMSIVLT